MQHVHGVDATRFLEKDPSATRVPSHARVDSAGDERGGDIWEDALQRKESVPMAAGSFMALIEAAGLSDDAGILKGGF